MNMTDEQKNRLEDLKARQLAGEHLPCPRCGRDTMDVELMHNALSRHTDVMLCSSCGMYEGLEAMKGIVKPLTEWACFTPPAPSELPSASELISRVMLTHLLLWGNSYCQIVRNGRGHIIGLYPLLPEQMTVDRDSSGKLTYDYMTRDSKQVRLRPEDVLHIPGLGFDGVMGYSPIALEKNAIGLGLAAEEYGSKFFSNGATPAGVLTHPNTVKNPSALRESWNAAYGGSSNSNRVAILEEGLKFERISMPNNEAQFLETRKFQVSEICRIYRVPPHLVGDLEHATFSNIEFQGISFAVHTIRPWLVRIEQSMNRALFPEKEKAGSPAGGRFYTRFNMDGLMRGAYKERMEGYAIGRQNGWLSTNDIRDLENMNPISDEEGGNAYLCNGNMIPIRTAMENSAEAAKANNKKTEEKKK